jgi:hypothetical protein
MSERQPDYSDYEPQSANTSLDRLSRDLNTLTNGVSLIMAFQNYIKDELKISDIEADSIYKQLLGDGIISDVSDYDESCVELKEEYRIALFTGIRSEYQLRHTTDEYDEWLPHALATMLPKDGRHDIEICYIQNGPTPTECEWGRCPLWVVRDETTRALVEPDFNSFEYIIDSDKAIRQTVILLSHAVKRGIIPKHEKRQLESCYEMQCAKFFGSVR